MMTYKYGNWYCVPANKEEAREIVERAVVSGAKIYDAVGENGGGQQKLDRLGAWGVLNGMTYTGYAGTGNAFEHATEHTITKLRKLFPMPGEQANTGWNGEGLPPIGTVCEIYMGPYHSDRRESGEVVKVLATAENSSGKTMALVEICEEDGECDALNVQCLRPLHNERDQWVEDALNILQKDPTSMPAQLMGMIYDSMKSGDLKVP